MAGNGFLDTLGSFVPSVLTGNSPAEQRMQAGGGVLSNLGGLAADVGHTAEDYTPAGAIKQVFSPQGAGIAALVGLGGALAIHGYHQWKAGNLPFDESGSVGLPGQERMQPPLANAPSWANTEYRVGLYPDRVDRLMHVQSAQDVAAALTRHDPQYATAAPRHLLALQGVVNDLGDSLLNNVDAHRAWADGYPAGRPQSRAMAAAWSLAQLDTAYHRGLIDSPQFNADYERLITRAHTLTDERQPLIDAATALSKELAFTYTPDLALPAPLDLVGMRFTPDGVETTMAYRRGALPHDMEHMDVWARERALNYQALIPLFVDNKLHLFNNPEQVTEPWAHVGRSGVQDPFESREGDAAWYHKAHNVAVDLATEYHLDPFEVAPAVVSALSPRAKWGANLDAARQLLKEYSAAKQDQGGVVTRPFLEPPTPSGNAPQSLRTRYDGVLPESVYRAQRILLGEPVPEVLQALKMRNFATNISTPDNPYPVTVDTLNQMGAFGYHTGNKNPVVFEYGNDRPFSARGAAAFEAHATADRLVARYTGLPTASAAQAKTWGPVSYIANRAKGLFDIPGAPSSVRTVVLGWGNPGPGFIADKAAPYSAAGDVLAPAKQPQLGRKGSLTAPAFVVTARPDGTFLVHMRAGEPGVRDVLRTQRPLGVDAGPFNRAVPVVPRPVESADQLRAAIQLGAESAPPASRVEVHNGAAPDVHPSTMPGNWFHYVVDGQDEAQLHGIGAAVRRLAPDANIGVAAPHTVYEAQNPLVDLGPGDLAGMGPEVFASDQSPLNKVQWVGISGERIGRSAQDNYKAHRQLGAELRRRGYDPVETSGVYGGERERSYLVFGMPNHEAIDLARDFGQESVATPSGLYYPALNKFRETDGQPTQIEVVGRKGAKLTDNYGEVSIGGKQVRYSHGYDWSDDEPQSDIVDPNAPHQPTARVRQELRVHLGPVAAPQLVQALADLGREHPGVGMKAYLHGDVLKPNGFVPVAEHAFNDVASTVIHQGTSLKDTDPNGVTAYLPEGDALGVHYGRHPVLDSAQRGSENEISPFGVVNNELRVVTPNADLSPNPFVAQIDGQRVSKFALYLPDATAGQPMELPELALGDDARQQMFARNRPAARLIEGTIKGSTVRLRPPAAGQSQDMVLFHVAREYLARHGVKVGETPLPLEAPAEATA